MRGKPSYIGFGPILIGLIPAHAGKTQRAKVAVLACGAHPRACGENTALFEVNWRDLGSSPRMRGKRYSGNGCLSMTGLIPAHAGKTPYALRSWALPPAHPRACGENPPSDWPMKSRLGSSPRMRGKPRNAILVGVCSRLIPAHAGKTRYSRRQGSSNGWLIPAHAGKTRS